MSQRMLDTFASAPAQSASVPYEESLRVEQVQEIERSIKRKEALNAMKDLIPWIALATLFGIECYMSYDELNGSTNNEIVFTCKTIVSMFAIYKSFETLDECFNQRMCLIKPPLLRRVFNYPSEYDIITNPDVIWSNISPVNTIPSNATCEQLIDLLRAKDITMKELIRACNETNRNMIGGFAHLATRMVGLETRMTKLEIAVSENNYILLIICKHLNIPIEELLRQRAAT